VASKMTMEKCLDDWRESVDERIDNLCAVYQSKGLRRVISALLSVDSTSMLLFKLLADRVDESDPHDERLMEELTYMVKNSLSCVASQVVMLLDVRDDVRPQLMEDIVQIIKTRYELEDKLNAINKGKSNEA